MRRLLTCLLLTGSVLSCAYGAENRLLLTGLSFHEVRKNQFGETYNMTNTGFGYEHNRFTRYGEWYLAGNVMLMNDSFRNPQLTLGLGHAIRYRYELADLSVGAAGFVGWKKFYNHYDTDKSTGHYDLTGGVTPVVSLYRGEWSLNLIYIPTMQIGTYDITGFMFAYLGVRF